MSKLYQIDVQILPHQAIVHRSPPPPSFVSYSAQLQASWNYCMSGFCR